MTFVALLIGAYALGSIPLGVLAARAHGVDLSKVGSGNIGATNVARALGPRWALLVLLFDAGKGYFPALAATLLFTEFSQERALAAGFAAVIGHCASPWLRFRGGKGIATGLGMLLGSSPIVAAIALGVFMVLFGVTSIVSVSSIASAVTLPLSGLLLHEPAVIVWGYGGLLAYILYRHIPNMRRLAKGEEPKFQFKGSSEALTKGQAKDFGGRIQEESGAENVESMEPGTGDEEEPAGSEHAVRRTKVGP